MYYTNATTTGEKAPGMTSNYIRSATDCDIRETTYLPVVLLDTNTETSAKRSTSKKSATLADTWTSTWTQLSMCLGNPPR